MGGVDRFLERLPGTPTQKAAVASVTLCVILGYPIFRVQKETLQGHDYFSQEKPEAIRAGEERRRREQRKLLEEQKQQSDKSS